MDLCFNYKGKAIKTLVEIPGIKEKTAIKIIDGIKDNEKLILELEEILDLVSFKKEKARFKACFTKIRPNDDLSDFITVKGGLATDTLTKDVDFLVIPMKGVTSSKTEKAQKWGIPVIALNECESYINENYPLFK
jgi:NAD-dependent DNA ligase